MATLSIVSPNSVKTVYKGENGAVSGSDITTFTKDGATSIRSVNGVDYPFKFRRVYPVSDLDPVVEGTFQYVSGGEKLMALEGKLSDEQKEMKGRHPLAFTVSKTQDGYTLTYDAVGGKSYALTVKPGDTEEVEDLTDESKEMATVSIVSPNSVKTVYKGENGAVSGSDITTFTKDGATSIRSVNGVDYPFKFRRV